MRFLEPEMATWLLAVPVAASLWLVHLRAKQGFRRRASYGPRLQRVSRISGGRLDVAVLAAALVGSGALALSLTRPQVFLESRVPEYERQDMVLILDRSASMRARDVPPSRFVRAIREIRAFLAEKPDEIDRVGLVGFAGASLTLSHLTSDVDTLFFFLDWIREDPEVHFGTDITSAVTAARDLARRDERPTRKIFLILSDGDDQGSPLAGLLEELRRERTRVHCIGIGTGRETPIPLQERGGVTDYLLDDEGQLLLTRFDESTLRQIAAVTGGRFFRSTTGRELADAMNEVVRQERRQVGWKHVADYRDAHPLLLALAGAATFFLLVKA